MSEVLLPTWIVPEEEPQEPLDEGSSVFRAAFAPGIAQRQSYGSLRLKLSRKHTVRAEEKAQLLSIMRATNGQYNALRTKVHFAFRGSHPTTELLSNPTFASGTTGWGAQAASLSVQDRILRLLATTQGQPIGLNRSSVAVTQYAPHVMRAAMYPRVTNGASYGVFISDGTLAANGYGTSTYSKATLVPSTTTVTVYGGVINDSSAVQGDWLDISWTSLSRCALVDNGVNSLTRSDEFDNAAWTKTRCSVSANATADPDGGSTMDAIVEDATASNTHRISQSATVSALTTLDYCAAFTVKANTRTWAYVILSHATGEASAFINLATGALGTVSNGTSWTNARAYVDSLGDGQYRIYLIAKKTSAATTVSAVLGLSTGDTVQTYSGDGVSSIYAWRGSLAQSAVPNRGVQTVGSAATGTSQTGSTLYVKGLPVSTNGLLLPEDGFEIGDEYKQATFALNSPGSGLGVLLFEPQLVRSPANDDPVIFCDPMGKFLVQNIKVQNQFGTQATVSYDLEHIYE